MSEKTEEWHLPIRPIAPPADIDAALARAQRDAFLAQHAPGDRRPPSIFTSRGTDEARGR